MERNSEQGSCQRTPPSSTGESPVVQVDCSILYGFHLLLDPRISGCRVTQVSLRRDPWAVLPWNQRRQARPSSVSVSPQKSKVYGPGKGLRESYRSTTRTMKTKPFTQVLI